MAGVATAKPMRRRSSTGSSRQGGTAGECAAAADDTAAVLAALGCASGGGAVPFPAPGMRQVMAEVEGVALTHAPTPTPPAVIAGAVGGKGSALGGARGVATAVVGGAHAAPAPSLSWRTAVQTLNMPRATRAAWCVRILRERCGVEALPVALPGGASRSPRAPPWSAEGTSGIAVGALDELGPAAMTATAGSSSSLASAATPANAAALAIACVEDLVHTGVVDAEYARGGGAVTAAVAAATAASSNTTTATGAAPTSTSPQPLPPVALSALATAIHARLTHLRRCAPDNGGGLDPRAFLGEMCAADCGGDGGRGHGDGDASAAADGTNPQPIPAGTPPEDLSLRNFDALHPANYVRVVASPFPGRAGSVLFVPADYLSSQDKRLVGYIPTLTGVEDCVVQGAYGVGAHQWVAIPKKAARGRAGSVFACVGEGVVRFGVLMATLQRAGVRLTSDPRNAALWWAKRVKPAEYGAGRCAHGTRRVNHFPGTWGLGRKDSLARNISRMKQAHGECAYGFHPDTFILPADTEKLARVFQAEAPRRGSRSSAAPPVFILKPAAQACGRGIRLLTAMPPSEEIEPSVVQRYLSPPFLIDGYKVDFRLYVVVTSVNPLRIYLYDEGMVRFATEKYPGAGHITPDNQYAHLTNYSINKFNERYTAATVEGGQRRAAGGDASAAATTATTVPPITIPAGGGGEAGGEGYIRTPRGNGGGAASAPPPQRPGAECDADIDDTEGEGGAADDDDEADSGGSKWTLTQFRQYCAQRGIDFAALHAQFCDVVVKTVLSVEDAVFTGNKTTVKERDRCFQIFGVDVMVDGDLRAHLLEVNVMPSLNSMVSALDAKIKCNLVADLLTLVGVRLPSGGSGDAGGAGPLSVKDRLEREAAKRAAAARASRQEEAGGVAADAADADATAGGMQRRLSRKGSAVRSRIDAVRRESAGSASSVGSAANSNSSSRRAPPATPPALLDSVKRFWARLAPEQRWVIADSEEEHLRRGHFARVYPTAAAATAAPAPPPHTYAPYFSAVRDANTLLREWEGVKLAAWREVLGI